MSLDKIHHIAIQVDDIAQAVAWYQQNFNINVKYEDDTWAMLEFDNIKLALVVPYQHPYHFAVSRKDARSFGELKTHRDHTQSTHIKDPSGNVVEVMLCDNS